MRAEGGLARDSSRKIRTLIVDDEPLARSNVTVLLRPDSEIEIVGYYHITIFGCPSEDCFVRGARVADS